ncbi:sigma 54-interacting transcriptional regulator [Sporolactobacillus shoreicorticis]|uniref:Sigma 54-interacting transcriptional regulator n=1 Tax=Sporolactobacillus shoreicorticis TaxID=1923877 RepID=A0ABW5S0A4_9BACL|nr:sigma 54-interacting transcriptional regulator [Sporolactobacillus shoreicorticis]MCO7124684.1 sigma 54-interacting transcriptional regulator [Sporolactobacillus shoreicorticis]
MSVKDKIFQYIVHHYEKKEITAYDVAAHFSMSRNTASSHLNQLVKEGKINKDNTRPTHFFLRTVNENDDQKADTFSSFIGYQLSIRNEIKKCKAAVNYPNGLPVLIKGNSGVGKSYLASLIYRYAVDHSVIDDHAPFIVLNCADYANNVELLSSVLFGYQKGAFTGAQETTLGLIDEADGGYLFLDEVHNLSAENQEKLFILIDQHKFRRLGDKKNWQHVNVRLIMATTEDIESTLLSTFRRRIPLEINLPDYDKRSYMERFNIAAFFYNEQAKIVQHDIYVDKKYFATVMSTRYDGNIGELKNRIKVQIAENLSTASDNKIVLTKTGAYNRLASFEVASMYRFIWNNESKRQNFIGYPDKHATAAMQIDQIFDFKSLINRLPRLIEDIENELSSALASHHGLNIADLIPELTDMLRKMSKVGKHYGLTFNDKEINEIGLLIYIYGINPLFMSRTFTVLEKDLMIYFRSFTISTTMLKACSGQNCPSMRSCLAATLTAYVQLHSHFSSNVLAIIVMHGENNATSLAYTANEMIGDYIYQGFDMPINVGVKEIIQRVNEYVRSIDTSHGLLLLVDMGSLEEMYEKIIQNVNGDLLIVNNVSTAMVLNYGLKLHQGVPLMELIESEMADFVPHKQYYAGLSQKKNVLISCISGEGIAVKMKDIVSKYINAHDVEIITMDYRHLIELINRNKPLIFKNTIAILTTSNLDNRILPIINIEEIVNGMSSLNSLSPFLVKNVKDCTNEIIKLFTLEGASERLNFLNPVKVINEVDRVIKGYEKFYNIEFKNFLRINLFLHLSAMIERLLKGEGIDEPLTPFIRNHKEVFQDFVDFSNLNFKEILSTYNLVIPKAEYATIYQIIAQVVANKS